MITGIGLVGTVLAVLAGLATLAALGGAMRARWRSAADEATLTVWKGEAEAQKARADRLDAAIAVQQEAMSALTMRVEKVEHENSMLRELVTGRQEINALNTNLTTRFDRLEALLTPSPLLAGGAN